MTKKERAKWFCESMDLFNRVVEKINHGYGGYDQIQGRLLDFLPQKKCRTASSNDIGRMQCTNLLMEIMETCSAKRYQELCTALEEIVYKKYIFSHTRLKVKVDYEQESQDLIKEIQGLGIYTKDHDPALFSKLRKSKKQAAELVLSKVERPMKIEELEKELLKEGIEAADYKEWLTVCKEGSGSLWRSGMIALVENTDVESPCLPFLSYRTVRNGYHEDDIPLITIRERGPVPAGMIVLGRAI